MTQLNFNGSYQHQISFFFFTKRLYLHPQPHYQTTSTGTGLEPACDTAAVSTPLLVLGLSLSHFGEGNI